MSVVIYRDNDSLLQRADYMVRALRENWCIDLNEPPRVIEDLANALRRLQRGHALGGESAALDDVISAWRDVSGLERLDGAMKKAMSMRRTDKLGVLDD